MAFAHTCTKCQRVMTVPERFIGQDLKCLECGSPFKAEIGWVDQNVERPVHQATHPLGGQISKHSHRSRSVPWVLVAIVLLTVLWVNRYRRDHIQLSDGSTVPVRENRLTGTTEVLVSGQWTASGYRGAIDAASAAEGAGPTEGPGATESEIGAPHDAAGINVPQRPAVAPADPARSPQSASQTQTTQDSSHHKPEVLVTRFDSEAYKNQRRQQLADEAQREAEAKREQEKEKQREDLKLALANCIEAVNRSYREGWAAYCAARGQARNCMLPPDALAALDQNKAQRQAECHRLYDTIYRDLP